MKKLHLIAFAFTTVLAFTSCQDHFDINQLNESQKLLLYCFASATDSTDIQVSATTPFTGKGEMPKDVKVHCYVNEKEEKVRFLRNDDTDDWDKLIYRLSITPKEGDEIKIEAESSNIGTATCTTTLPAKPAIASISYRPIQIDGEHYQQLCVTMENTPGENNYFAVKVYSSEHQKNWGLCDVNTYSEPLLNNYIMGIPAFDESISYYDGFYIFDNSNILNDSTYTLHLNIEEKSEYYKVQLYHITYSMYRFLKSINDQDNNEFGKYGLSFIRPTYSNIINGCGVMGGYTIDEKIYHIPEFYE